MRALNIRSIVICFMNLLLIPSLAEARTINHGLWLRDGADDAYARNSSEQYVDREYLQCGGSSSGPYVMSGFRFKLYIPRGSQVVSSSLDLSAYVRDWMGGYYDSLYGIIRAEAVDNASNFNQHYMGTVPRTIAGVDWDQPERWSNGWILTSPDISTVVQEVVNRPGWRKGNWIAILYCNRPHAGYGRSPRLFMSFEDQYFDQYFDTKLDCTFRYVEVSGHIRMPDGSGVQGATVSAQDGSTSTTTDPNGYYKIEVGMNWNGTVVPDKAGWAFDPNVRTYVNATPEQTNQDFTGFAPPVISGHIVDSEGLPTSDVLVSSDNGGGSGITDPNGHYDITVDQHWSGTVTAYKEGWAFEPNSRDYLDLTIDQNDQDYTSFAPPVISGFVIESNGLPTEGVLVSADNGGGSNVSDPNGYYEFTVGQHWSGAVIPYKDGWSFEPNSRDYSNLIIDQNGQDYTSFSPPVISGRITEANGIGVSGVGLFANNGGGSDTTDPNGYYALLVPQKWSGTITPVKHLWFFEPDDQSYENITYNITDQDFEGVKGVVISGYITNPADNPVYGVDVSANNGGTEDTTDTSGFYEIAVLPNWSGEVTLSTRYPCRLFVPQGRSYMDLVADQTDQSYISPGLLVTSDGLPPCGRISASFRFAIEGDAIILEPGIHSGFGNYRISFGWFSALTIRSTDPLDQNIVASTVIDLEGQGPAFLFEYGEDANCIIDGITITGGYSIVGGGIYCSESSPTIRNCVIKDCYAGSHGGGIGLEDSSATISNCIITGNSSPEIGGGIAVVLGSKPKIINCIITNNYVDYLGGGIGGWDFDLNNCIVTGNIASIGGGIGGSDINVTNCTVAGNIADYGGGICSTDGIVSNSIVWDNNAATGAQIAVYDYDEGTDILSVFYSNVPGGEDSVYVDPMLVLNWGLGNIEADPCFVDAGYWDANGTPGDANDDYWVDGDYHLKSEGWRWDVGRGVWTWDDVTSLCIDAGNPGSALGDEPLSVPDDPDNEWGENIRINMGAYGGTAEASMGPVGWALLADMNNDGVVDFADVGIWAGYWLEADIELPGDLNRDSLVNGFDFALVGQDFGN